MKGYLKLLAAASLFLTVFAVGRAGRAEAQSALQPTQVAVVSAQNPASSAQTITFTATVEGMSPDSGMPTGLVEFFAGQLSMGQATLVNANGLATASITVKMASGIYPILARYYGDSNFAFGLSIPPLTQRVLEQ